jgi:hypothetical protein
LRQTKLTCKQIVAVSSVDNVILLMKKTTDWSHRYKVI